MKHLLMYVAVAVALIAIGILTWVKFFSAKASGPSYTMGKGRGLGVDFMDSSKAQGGITPVKGTDLEGIDQSKGVTASLKNPWFGKLLAVKSSVPTSNPVRVQTQTIWNTFQPKV